ncbi:MAG: hypothetical protein PWP23_147 [Candidatus Sumerlaeota bacterium]|nr:hypothetical protein [Candidatus Sumerlaeota bacterium]
MTTTAHTPADAPTSSPTPPTPPGPAPRSIGSRVAHWYARVFDFQGMTRGVLSRPSAIVCLIGAITGYFLPATGIGMSTCGMLRIFGLPCPGCGLTRSVSSFLQGHFVWSFHYHPLGWVFAVIFVLIGSTALMPTRWREAIIARVTRYDQALGSGFLIFCTLLLLYGFIRMGMVQMGAESQRWWRETEGTTPPFIHQHDPPPAQESH